MQTPEPDQERRDPAEADATGQQERRDPADADATGQQERRDPAEADATGHECLEWCPICRGAEMIKAAVPPEVADQLQLVQRDVLLLVQALVEAQLARIREQEAGDGDAGVTSIPVE